MVKTLLETENCCALYVTRKSSSARECLLKTAGIIYFVWSSTNETRRRLSQNVFFLLGKNDAVKLFRRHKASNNIVLKVHDVDK